MIEQSIILLQIIFIDIVLAADNAIIIGLIAANFIPKHRKQIILWGVAGALVFKVIFALFATYVTFFPQLVAGPILRAKEVIPQLNEKRSLDIEDIRIGLRRIIFGLFLKVVH